MICVFRVGDFEIKCVLRQRLQLSRNLVLDTLVVVVSGSHCSGKTDAPHEKAARTFTLSFESECQIVTARMPRFASSSPGITREATALSTLATISALKGIFRTIVWSPVRQTARNVFFFRSIDSQNVHTVCISLPLVAEELVGSLVGTVGLYSAVGLPFVQNPRINTRFFPLKRLLGVFSRTSLMCSLSASFRYIGRSIVHFVLEATTAFVVTFDLMFMA